VHAELLVSLTKKTCLDLTRNVNNGLVTHLSVNVSKIIHAGMVMTEVDMFTAFGWQTLCCFFLELGEDNIDMTEDVGDFFVGKSVSSFFYWVFALCAVHQGDL